EYFFISSRRRHTRLVSDWSSDVCSSDLASTTQISSQLKEAKKASYELRTTAERLLAMTRGSGHHWQSHSRSLNEAREHVNRLGRSEERRVGKSVDHGGGRDIRKKKNKKQ